MSYYSMNATYLKNTLRISGLSSGMDTEALVKASMISSQNKANAYTRRISQLTWQRDATRELNTMLDALRNDFSTITKQQQNLTSAFNYKMHAVNFAKETTAVSIDASQSTFSGSGSIKIMQLATADVAASKNKVTKPDLTTGTFGSISGTDTMLTVLNKLADPSGFQVNSSTDMVRFDIGGQNFEFSINTRFSEVLSTINAAGLGFSVSYSQLTDKMTVAANETGRGSALDLSVLKNSSFFKSFGLAAITDTVTSSSKVTKDSESISLDDKISDVYNKLANNGGIIFADGKYELTVGGVKHTFDPDDKFSMVINDINSKMSDSNESPGITVSYSEETNRMTVTTRGTGVNRYLDSRHFEDNAFFMSFGIDASSITQVTQGVDAIAEITHGADKATIVRPSNSFSIDGIQYDLSRADPNETIEFNVERDIEGTVELVKKYVEEYNKVIEKLYTMFNEKPNKNFPPLTDDQRLSMTAQEIEQWETEAKKGLFYRDNRLRSLLSDLRGSFYSAIGNTGKVMANIGLGTSNYYDGGKITVDESALRAAIRENPDEVFKMFAQQTMTTSSSGSEVMDHANSGVIRRINDLLYSYVGDNKGYYIPKTEDNLRSEGTKQLEHLTKMYQEENRLYAKYAAMEKALAQLNSQTSALSNLISAGL